MRFPAAILLALALTQPAFAQSAASSEKFTCDAPGGSFSRYERPIGFAPTALSAKVRINQLRSGTGWRPVVNLMLSAGAGNRVGLRFLPDRQRKKTMVFVAFPGVRGGEEKGFVEADMNAQFDVTIGADRAGTRISVNGMSQSGPPLSDGTWTLDLSCSSVDSHIEEIALKAQ